MTEAPPLIHELVQKFEHNLDEYKNPKYNETLIRVEFVNPFWKALGWDVDNEAGYAMAYRDVIHEDEIKIGSATKAPDYSFRIGGTRKFFLETKKPAVNLKNDPAPAFQLRRYAYSANLPISVLTDFEEFIVYECRKKPVVTDKPAVGRVMYFTFREYVEQWDKISTIFSKPAVLKGDFDKFARGTEGKRGTDEINKDFLADLDQWRMALARTIALRNQELNARQINYAVQLTIDRLIFLRMCEDRGIENYGQLLALLNGTQIYPRLVQIYYRADERFNSGLFHFTEEKQALSPPDILTPGLSVDDKVLKDIIKHLYYPECPYEFSIMPVEVLGNAYEQFLGKVIRLTKSHQAKIEEKPEVRKAGGVYYTPKYIVDYIVENTVGKLCENQTPKAVSELRIVDPACGSGSFLLGAYQYLLDWHLKYYQQLLAETGQIPTVPPDKGRRKRKSDLPAIFQGRGGEWFLTTVEKKRILTNNIYGVDIDANAVEVTKLSLLLKVLENESQASLAHQLTLWHERALPDLAQNIKCGNSLIGTDFYTTQPLHRFDEEEMLRINAFNWDQEFPAVFASGGFDAVIGNPPYDVLEKERGRTSWPHNYLSEYAKTRNQYCSSLGGKLNLFRFFIVRSFELLKKTGYWGMIVPLSILADISCSNTRQFLIHSSKVTVANCFPQKDDKKKRIFQDAKLSTVIITSQKEISKENLIRVFVHPGNLFEELTKRCDIFLNDLSLFDPKNKPVPLLDQKDLNLCKKIYNNPNILFLNEVNDFQINRGEINQTIFREFIDTDELKINLVKGVEIGRYRINQKLSQGIKEYFDEEKYLNKGKIKKSLSTKRRIATQRITGVDERYRIVATILEPPNYFADSTNSITINLSSKYSLEYLLSLLNSKLFQWRFKLTSTNNNVGTNELECLPFRHIDFLNKNDLKTYNQIVNLVKILLDLNVRFITSKEPHLRQLIQRQIEATDRQIDQLVYQLYELTDEEIKIVEEAVA